MLLTDLDLIRLSNDERHYVFNKEGRSPLPAEVVLYALVQEKGEADVVDYDTLQKIGDVFCLSDIDLIERLLALQEEQPDTLRYSDTAGLRQVQFLKNLEPSEVLRRCYTR